jgi:outer membrane receptor protein involved in Fe transport
LGKLGFFVNSRIVDSNGWLNGERRYMPEDGWEIEVYREWYWATYDPPDPLVIPIPDSMHTGDGKIVSMNWSKLYNINTKLVYQPLNTLTASYNLFYSNSNGKEYSNSWRFCPEGTGQSYGDNITHMLTITHTLKANLFYNLRYSYQQNKHKNYMYEDPNDPRYQTTAVNAWDPGKNTGYDYGGIYSWERRWYDQKINLFNGDITWQINKVIELKTGFEGKTNSLHYKNAPMREVLGFESLQFPFIRNEIRELELPYSFFRDSTANFLYGNIKLRESSPDSSQDDQFYVDYIRRPFEGAAYIQTKLTLGEIILNAGLRYDYFQPNDRYAPDYSKVFPELVGDNRYYEDAKDKSQLSPRFGLSFPISSRGALRLSYGHFFQKPSYEKMYQNPVLPNYNQFSIAETRIGNPNLKPEKTIQYEIGLQQQLNPQLSMELSVFYKDIRDLLGIEILTLSNATTFYRYVNKEYGNSSGLTLSFNHLSADKRFSANIDYTYMIAKGSASSPELLRDISILSGSGKGAYTIAIRKINYLDWDQTHSLNATVSFRPLPSWNISLLGQLGSGLPYSPTTLDPSIELPGGEWDNADRKPLRWELDLKILKSFRMMGLRMNAYVNIYNVFNHLNENRVHPITGKAGPDAYLPKLGLVRENRIREIGAFSLDEANYDPTYYSRPRLIQFGLFLGF